jgi:predicted dehydrogenase
MGRLGSVPGVSKRLRAAVIGCGAISKEHLSFIASSERADLVGVTDLSRAAREYAAQRYGAAAAYENAERLLAEAKPDVVHVLTPPRTHHDLSIAALLAGAHVVCEKPIAATLDELDDMYAVATETGRLLIESQNYRFNDGVVAIKELVANGELGDILEAEVRITLDIASSTGKFGDANIPSPVAGLRGGAVHDFLPHMAYSVLQMLPDGPFGEPQAIWRNLSGNSMVGFDDLDAICTVGDGVVRLRFASALKPEGFRILVRGTRGQAETDVFQPYLRVEIPRARGPLSSLANQAVNGASLLKSSVTGLRDKVLQHTPLHGMPRMLGQFYAAVAGDGPSPMSPSDVRRPMELVELLVEGVPAR